MLTEAQLERRKAVIGGSDLAAIMEIPGAFGGPWKVWASKVGIDVPSTIDPDLARVGNELEPVVAVLASRQLGVALADGPEWVQHLVAPLGGHPDGWLADGSGIELKTSSWGDPYDRQAAYEMQCRAYMIASGAPRWHLATLRVGRLDMPAVLAWSESTIEQRADMIERAGWTLTLKTIEPDPVLDRQIVEIVTGWWQRHVIGGEAPPPDATDACAAALLARHPEARAGMVAAPELAPLVEQYRDAHARIKADTALKDEAANAIKAAIGDSKGIDTPAGSATWSRFTRSSTDWKSVQAHHPEIAGTVARYTTASPTGRLNVK